MRLTQNIAHDCIHYAPTYPDWILKKSGG